MKIGICEDSAESHSAKRIREKIYYLFLSWASSQSFPSRLRWSCCLPWGHPSRNASDPSWNPTRTGCSRKLALGPYNIILLSKFRSKFITEAVLNFKMSLPSMLQEINLTWSAPLSPAVWPLGLGDTRRRTVVTSGAPPGTSGALS